MNYRSLATSIFLALSCGALVVSANQEPELKILERIKLSDNLDKFNSSLASPSEAGSLVNNGESLNIDYFIGLVKRNHPDIVSAQLSRNIASSKRLAAQGAFDPSINSQNSFNRFNSSSAPGKAQEAFTSNTSLDFLTGYGAKFGLGAKFAEGDIKTPISPTGEGGEYFIKAQVPLLRDAIYNSNSIKEKTSRLNETIADFILFRTQLNTLDAAIKAYWDWVASKKIIDIETNLRDLVAGQVEFVEQQAQLGNLADIAVVEAQRELQKRRSKVNSALRSFQNSSIYISKFTWDDSGSPYAIPVSEQVPADLPQAGELVQAEIEAAKLTALKNRPEFKALDLTRQISDFERKLAKNQMLPQLDAYMSSGIETGADSISGLAYEAGVNVSIPLRFRTALGQKREAEFKIKKLNLEERKLIQNVFLEIEDTASAVNTSYQKYLAAKQDFELSQQLEDGEKTRFELGDSTLFLVIRRQRATVQANIELIKTLADYHKARLKFELVQGKEI